jgi:DNA-binding Lrp family transcriptional regulator
MELIPMDRNIFTVLSNNPICTVQELSAQLQVPQKEVEQRIIFLENHHHLHRSWIVNKPIDHDSIAAWVTLEVVPSTESGFNEIAKRFLTFPQVESIYLLAGTQDISLFVRGKNLEEISHFLSRYISTDEFVRSQTTHFVLKTFKENGIPISIEEQNRLVLSP